MKAVVVEEWTEPSKLVVTDVPDVTHETGKVLIDVRAASCNFFDTLIVRGKYQVKPPFPFSPGGEVAGIVADIDKGSDAFAVGDRVMANVGYGGFAERVNARINTVQRIPDEMDLVQAAAFPIVYGTSHVAIVRRGQVRAGETMIVTAAAGGVGLAAVQIGKSIGARVIAVAGGAEKLEIARKAGADVTVDYRVDDWPEVIRRETDGRGADVIIENVGGDVFEACTRLIAWGGRIVVVGFAGGEVPSIRTNRILLKHISLVGVHFGPMAEHEPETLRETFRDLFDLYRSKKLAPLIWKRFSLAELPQALEALEERKTWGKIVIDIP